MSKEFLQFNPEGPQIEQMVLRISEKRKEDIDKEQANHFGITPAFRILTETCPEDFNFNRVVGARFVVPTVGLEGLKIDREVQGNSSVKISYPYMESDSLKSVEATFVNSDALKQEQKKVEEDLVQNKIAEIEEIKDVLPQKNELVMIDAIRHMGKNEIIASREISDLDFDKGDKKFNKLRFIEMIAQTAEFHFLRDINKGKEEKYIATGKEVEMDFYPAAEDIQKGDEIFIEITQSEKERESDSAKSEIYKKDGTLLAKNTFKYNKPIHEKKFEKIVERAKKNQLINCVN